MRVRCESVAVKLKKSGASSSPCARAPRSPPQRSPRQRTYQWDLVVDNEEFDPEETRAQARLERFRARSNPAAWLLKTKDFQARSRRRFFAVRAGRTRTPLWWPSVRVSAPPQAKVWCKTTHEVPRTRSWSFASRRRTAHPLSPGRRNYGGGYSVRRRRD